MLSEPGSSCAEILRAGACRRAANRDFHLALKTTVSSRHRLSYNFHRRGAGCRTANRGFYLVQKTAVSSRHRLCHNFAGEDGTSPLQREINQHLKFRPPFQRWWNAKAKPLVALRTGRNSFSVKKRRRGGKTVRRTVLTWGTLAGGSPVRCRRAHRIAAFTLRKKQLCPPDIGFAITSRARCGLPHGKSRLSLGTKNSRVLPTSAFEVAFSSFSRVCLSGKKTEEVFQWRDFLFWRFFFLRPGYFSDFISCASVPVYCRKAEK